MLSIKAKDIAKATNGIIVSGSPETEINSICTDSRKVKHGDLFIPLTGDNFNGHDFIPQAVNMGVCGYITSQQESGTCFEGLVVKVDDTLKALQDIAGFQRQKFDIPLVGITGSAGKTSTKDMIYEVLSKKFKVLRTEGNLNNHIGLPLTLLNLCREHEAAVVEMGMSGFGEISTLSKISRPHISLITNIGLAHIGKLGTRQNILKAKMEIFDGMDPDGLVILNGDDGLLMGLRDLLQYRTVFYGLQEGVDVQGYNIRAVDETNTAFNIQVNGREYTVTVPVPGIHNVYNALSAITVGLRFKVSMDDIVDGIKEFKPSKMRMNILTLKKGIRLINDAYNANPNSMEEALRVLRDFSGRRKIAVLGDMLELGEWTRQAHVDIGKSVVRNGVNYLVTLGYNSKYIAEGAASMGMSQRKIRTCSSIQEINQYLKNIIRDGDIILVKGSRGMKMEGIVEFISSDAV